MFQLQEISFCIVAGSGGHVWVNNGSNTDRQVFNHLELRQKTENYPISFPKSDSFIDHDPRLEYFILAKWHILTQDIVHEIILQLNTTYIRKSLQL